MAQKILQWNMRSYKTSFTDLKIILNNHAPICMCLQETLQSNQPNLRSPSHYAIVHSKPVRQDMHERGAAILIHNRVNYDIINLQTTLQAAAISIYLDRRYTVCSLYLPHHPVDLASMEQLINQLPHPLILMGDVNARSPMWGCDYTDARGRLFEEIFINHPLTVLNDDTPTHYHIQTNSYSIIDLAICSSQIQDQLTYRVTNDLHSSDHFPIEVTINNQPELQYVPPRFKTDKADWKLFRELTVADYTIENLSIPESVDRITHSIIHAAEGSIPKTTGRMRKPPVPWWSEDCRLAKQERTRAERALRRSPTLHNKIRYNRAKARARYIMNTAKQQSFKNFVNSINQTIPLNKVRKRVQKLEGRFSPTPLPVLEDGHGELVSDSNRTAEILGHHFASVSDPQFNSPQFQRHKRQIERGGLNFNIPNHQPYNDPITEREIRHALSTATDSSPGEDEVTSSMIKHLHPTLFNLLVQLYNRIFLEDIFPPQWTSAIIIAIPKPNKNRKKPENYRPISLTSTLCKLIERVVNHRLMWIMESENFICSAQSGFRANRSTIDNLVKLETHLSNSISERQHTIAIFFDIKKAYDTAWRFGLLKRLHEIGLRGHLPLFVQNFLTNRSIKVRVGTSFSQPYELLDGIPQGSVLSCTLFLIAINSITTALPASIHSVLYVDDFTIYASGSNTHTIERQLQMGLNSLARWSQQSGLQFSQEKTVSIHVCRKRHCPKMAPTLTLCGNPIRCVDSVRFLGVTIDNSLSWKQHIMACKKKCYAVLNLFKKLAHSNWGSDSTSLLRLFTMLIKPIMEYGLEAYSSAADSYVKSLQPIQNSAIRLATGAFRTSPVDSLHAYSSILPHEYATQIKLLNYYLRLIVNPSHPLHDSIVDYEDLDPDTIDDSFPKKSFLSRAHLLNLQYNFDSSRILIESNALSPPWRINKLEVCTDMFEHPKTSTPATILKQAFTSHCRSHDGDLSIYTDGSKTADGVGYAFVCGELEVGRRISRIASNYTAELLAIRDAIDHAENTNSRNVIIHSDSKSSIQAISSPYSKHPIVSMIQNAIISSAKVYTLCWVPSHIGIAGNEAADIAAQNSVTSLPITPMSVPRIDVKGYIKAAARANWQTKWQTIQSNKLRESLPMIAPKYHNSYPRSWSIKLARLQIGHSSLTHEYLLSRNPPPFCDDCIVPLTVKHILVECPSHAHHRHLFGCPGPPTLTDVFHPRNSRPGGPLYTFLQRVGIFNLI